MTTELVESPQRQVRELIDRLQSPVPDLSTLLSLLVSPLEDLGLLPPRFRRYNVNPLPKGAINTAKHIPPLQRALLEHVIPNWDLVLAEEQASPLIEQYFCPDPFSFTSSAAGEIALLAYSTILSLPLMGHGVRLLSRLSREYPIDRLHLTVFSQEPFAEGKRSVVWEDCVRNIAGVPAKVSNALGSRDVPENLEHAAYFNSVSVRCEVLIDSLSSKPSKEKISSVTYLLTKLVNLGLFPPSPPTSRSQPSFFMATIATIRQRLSAKNYGSYAKFWSDILQSIPSAFTLQTICTSLLSSLPEIVPPLDPSGRQRSRIKREGLLLRRLIGPLPAEDGEMWECFAAVALGRGWSESRARVLACWVAGAGVGPVDQKALEILLNKAVEMWSSPEHVKHSLLSRHHYLTCLLLVTLSHFPKNSELVQSLAFSPGFISAIGVYIGHLDLAIRRCGMLVAEVVAQHTGKTLNFGDWEGNEEGKSWARDISLLITAQDVSADADVEEEGKVEETTSPVAPAEIPAAPASPRTKQPKVTVAMQASGYDSDDSLTGYASPTSSRSASPTQEELDEIEKDPTLRVGIKKIPRPVYLAQLWALLRGPAGVQQPGEDNQEPDRIEMALNSAAELIRKKSGFGLELEENAVNLVHAFVGLQDNFDLEGFERKRQEALNALVACCPRKSAPAIIEEFFKNQYSTTQRYAMLNALAFGARELASMELPSPQVSNERTAFPSRMLPPGLHRKYITAQEQGTNVVRGLLDGISRAAIESGKDTNMDRAPELVRERRLRMQKKPKITEVKAHDVVASRPPNIRPIKVTFTEVAAEYFIAPLINRFWLFLRDEQTREARTAHHETLYRYRGAGTGLILSPIVLQHYLGILAILVHASQNAPEWLAVIAPDALELALTLGTRPISRGDVQDDDGEPDASEPVDKEASVLTTALELALVTLDRSLERDGGRSLSLEHTTLLLGAEEWAGRVLSRLQSGILIEGGGGALNDRLKRAAAGVLLKADEAKTRWGRSMVDFR